MLVAIIAYVASFAISLGPVMWVLLSEIFPNEERAAAISIVLVFGGMQAAISTAVTLRGRHSSPMRDKATATA